MFLGTLSKYLMTWFLVNHRISLDRNLLLANLSRLVRIWWALQTSWSRHWLSKSELINLAKTVEMCRKTMIVFLHISTVLAKFISSMENSLSRSFHVHLIPPPSIGCTFHRHWPPRRSWSSCAKWRATWRPSAWGFTIRIVHDCYGEDLMGYIYINTILISIYKYNHSTLYYSIRFVWKWWHTQNVNLWWGNWWFTIGFGERNLINYIFIYIYIYLFLGMQYDWRCICIWSE